MQIFQWQHWNAVEQTSLLSNLPTHIKPVYILIDSFNFLAKYEAEKAPSHAEDSLPLQFLMLLQLFPYWWYKSFMELEVSKLRCKKLPIVHIPSARVQVLSISSWTPSALAATN